MSDDDLIAAYRGRLTKEVQDAIMVAGIPPGKVANLYIESSKEEIIARCVANGAT